MKARSCWQGQWQAEEVIRRSKQTMYTAVAQGIVVASHASMEPMLEESMAKLQALQKKYHLKQQQLDSKMMELAILEQQIASQEAAADP